MSRRPRKTGQEGGTPRLVKVSSDWNGPPWSEVSQAEAVKYFNSRTRAALRDVVAHAARQASAARAGGSARSRDLAEVIVQRLPEVRRWLRELPAEDQRHAHALVDVVHATLGIIANEQWSDDHDRGRRSREGGGRRTERRSHRDVLDCAEHLRRAGHPERGLAKKIQQKLGRQLSERHINRILNRT